MIFQSVYSYIMFFANPQARKAQFMSVMCPLPSAQHCDSFLVLKSQVYLYCIKNGT